MHAVVHGKATCLSCLAESRANLNARDTVLGMTAVMIAAEDGRHESLLLLAENGANLDMQDDIGKTTVMLASENGRLSCVKTLTKRGASLNAQDSRGWTAIMLAAQHGHISTVSLLADKSANVNLVNKNGQTALILAVKTGDELCVKTLVEHGSKLLHTDNYGRTAAQEAERMGNQTCTVVLRENSRGTRLMGLWQGAPMGENAKSTKPQAPKEWFKAAWNGNEEVLGELMDDGVSPDVTDDAGWNAAMVACIRGHMSVLHVMIRRRADLNATDDAGWTAIMLAAKKGNRNCINLMLQNGADVGVKTADGLTAGILAASDGQVSCLKLLVEARADLDVRTPDSASAAMSFLVATGDFFVRDTARPSGVLDTDADSAAGPPTNPASTAGADIKSWFRAAERGCTDVLRKLISKGSPVNAIGDCGMTAVMMAAEQGDVDALKMLIDANADLDIRDKVFGRTAVSIAAANGQMISIKALIDTGGASAFEADNQGRTPVMEAAYNGHEKCVRFLARRGADLEAKDDEGLTAAALAAQQGHVLCLQVLAEQGACLLEKKRDGRISNPLLKVEHTHSMEAAMSVVTNWAARATMSVQGMCDSLKAASSTPQNCLVASLHLSLWKDDDWGKRHVRSLSYAESLFKVLEELLASCKDRSLTKLGKTLMSILLEAGLLKTVDAERRAALKQMNSEVLDELQKALDERQEVLQSVGRLTEEPDVRLSRRDRHGKKTTGKLDQRDAMPAATWKWLEELPDDSFQRLELAFTAFRLVGTCATPGLFADYLRAHGLLTDSALYARAAAHILVGYAQLVEEPFEQFMEAHFGSRFKHAPIKKLPRIFTKLAGDEPRLRQESIAAEEESLRCAYFALGDAVRGSLRADGPREMEDIVDQLQKLNWMSTNGKFEVWRIKNSHHDKAEEMTGGYRDVKVLGRFTAREGKMGSYPVPISMIVEIQVIDVVYLDIKNYMHKAYSIDRGDFD
jgi:ankyrin repeat protein